MHQKKKKHANSKFRRESGTQGHDTLYWNAYSDIIGVDRRFGTKSSDFLLGNVSILAIYSISKMTSDIISQSL